MADVVSPEVRSRMMASIRSRNTKPEMLVRRFLHRLGFRYRLSPRDLPGRPDLALPRHKVAVFVHGCFWHGHHGCRFATVPATRTDFWVAKIAANKVRDHANEEKLRDLGWRVAVVWECALRSNSDHAIGRVVDFITSNQRSIEVPD
ncbi:very short patch repair endonuclease [Lysobacter niastensis]|uniref:Very short patch repair endonuclease n=1 Tax=Lysobacter niastensis TaxID=380629 RepID=A0ABS0BE05_9GAMM|nr:very short patch repair endonuclease [Lysobacter niastensis]MBF6025350.1 DNA mismatch endonuclease Vsr [Lysobacter niastensis]